MTLFVIKDGLKGYACLTDKEGHQVLGTNYYALSYDFKSNEGYIEKKGTNNWRLYTQVGQTFGEDRYYHFGTFEECVEKLKNLKGNNEITICKSTEVENYK